MKKLTTYLLSTGAIVAATMAFTAVASAANTVTVTGPVLDEEGKEVATGSYETIDDAIAAITSAKKTDKDYTLTITAAQELSAKLPKTKSLTITAESAQTVTVSAKSLAATSPLTLNNINLTGDSSTKFTAKDNVTLTGTSKLGTFGSVKGAKGKTITAEANQDWAFEIAGFGTIKVPESVTFNFIGGAKKAVTATTLDVAAGAQVNVYGKTVQVDEIKGTDTSVFGFVYTTVGTDDSAVKTAPAAINVKKELKSAAGQLKYYTATGTENTTTGVTEYELSASNLEFPVTKVITSGDKDAADIPSAKFTIATPDDATVEYTFSTTKKDTYVRPVTFSVTGLDTDKFALWTDITAAIEKKAAKTAEYTVSVLADADIGGAMKFPKKDTYKSISIVSAVEDTRLSESTASKKWAPKLYTYFKNGDNVYVAETDKATESEVAEVKYYKVTFDGNDFKSAEEVSSIPSGGDPLTSGSKYDSVTAAGYTGLTQISSDYYTTKPTGKTITTITYSAKKIVPGSSTVEASLSEEASDTVEIVAVDGTISTSGYKFEGSDTTVWISLPAKAQLKFTGGISATGDVTFSDIEFFSYKYDKKNNVYNGVATSLAASKNTLTLDNVSLYGGVSDGNGGYTVTPTTLKSVAAQTLKVNGDLTALKISANTLDETERSATLAAQSYAFKTGVTGEAGSVTVGFIDKSGAAITAPTNKQKITVGSYGNQFLFDGDYVFAFSGKNLIPVAWDTSSETYPVFSLALGTKEENATDYTYDEDAAVKFADLKSVATYLTNAVKAKTAKASDVYKLDLGGDVSKFSLPKAGTYGTLNLTSTANSFSTPLEISLKSLKLTGNLVTDETVKIEVSGKTSGTGKFTDGYDAKLVKSANDAYTTAVNALFSKVNGKKVNGTDDAAWPDIAAELTAVENAAKNEKLATDDDGIKQMTDKYNAITAAIAFWTTTGNQDILAKLYDGNTEAITDAIKAIADNFAAGQTYIDGTLTEVKDSSQKVIGYTWSKAVAPTSNNG